jgi:formyltetrahydrofolate synthetase
LNNKQKKGGKSIEDQQKEIVEKKKKQEKDVKELKKTSSMLEVEMEEITKKMNVAKESENSNQDQIINLQSRAHTVQK